MWYVYICDRNGKLHTGISINDPRQMDQHKAKLLYYEAVVVKKEAIQREREIRRWPRGKKLELVQSGPTP